MGKGSEKKPVITTTHLNSTMVPFGYLRLNNLVIENSIQLKPKKN